MAHFDFEVINHLASLYAPFLVNDRCTLYLTGMPNSTTRLARQLAARPAMYVSSTTGSLGKSTCDTPFLITTITLISYVRNSRA